MKSLVYANPNTRSETRQEEVVQVNRHCTPHQGLLGLETGTKALMNGFWMIRLKASPVFFCAEAYGRIFQQIFNPQGRRIRVHASREGG